MNDTVTNELLEVYKNANFSQDIMFYDFFPYSVIVTNTKRGIRCVYLLNKDTSLYRHESTF